jgi:hypothetical protein
MHTMRQFPFSHLTPTNPLVHSRSWQSAVTSETTQLLPSLAEGVELTSTSDLSHRKPARSAGNGTSNGSLADGGPWWTPSGLASGCWARGRPAAVAAGLVMLLVLVLLHTSWAYLAYNSRVALQTHLQPMHSSTLQFSGVPSTGDFYECESDCYFWNPAVLFHRGRYLVAVRESTHGHCGGTAIVKTIADLLLRPALNSVLIGVLDKEPSAPVVTVPLLGRMPNGQLPDDGDAHFGFEDPRWIWHQGQMFVLATREVSSQPAMFLTPVTALDSLDLSTRPPLAFGASVQLQSPRNHSFGGKGGQKNWMHVPLDEPEEAAAEGAAAAGGTMLFVNTLDPLIILRSDPRDGTSEVHFQGRRSDRSYYGHHLSGSSNFLSVAGLDLRPGERAGFVGLAHSRRDHPVFGGSMHEYVTYFVRLALLKDPAAGWSLDVSEKLVLPVDGTTESARINFPTAITETPNGFLISIGEMDCTSHVVSLEKKLVLSYFNDKNLTPS